LKRGFKITSLISAIIWFVFQSKQFIFQLTNKDLLSTPQPVNYIVETFVVQIPWIIFATITIIFLMADLFDKKTKYEKIFCAISAITFLPRISADLADFYNIIAISKTSNEIGMNFQPSMKLFALLIDVSMFTFLIIKIFEIKKSKIFIVLFFSISCITNMLLTFLYFSASESMINNFFEVIGSTLLWLFAMLIAVVGLMLINKDVAKTSK